MKKLIRWAKTDQAAIIKSSNDAGFPSEAKAPSKES